MFLAFVALFLLLTVGQSLYWLAMGVANLFSRLLDK